MRCLAIPSTMVNDHILLPVSIATRLGSIGTGHRKATGGCLLKKVSFTHAEEVLMSDKASMYRGIGWFFAWCGFALVVLACGYVGCL